MSPLTLKFVTLRTAKRSSRPLSATTNTTLTPRARNRKVTTFVNLEVWGKPAENFSKLVKKGQELFAEGKLRMDEWTDKQTSARRTRLYLLVENWQFTQYKRQEDNNTPGASASAAAAPSSPPPTRDQ